MIKCIIFDLGEVVLTNDWAKWYKKWNDELCEYFSVTLEDLERAWKAHWFEYKTGAISEDEFWKRFLTETGTEKIDVGKTKELWRKYQHPINDMFELIERLKKKYKILALANIGSGSMDYKVEKFNLNKYFHKIIGSAKVGVAKPEKEIYLIALKGADCKPEECIYIDDQKKNLNPAEKMGIKVILFKSKEQLIQELKEYGVNLE